MKWLAYVLIMSMTVFAARSAHAQESDDVKLAKYKAPNIGARLEYEGWTCTVALWRDGQGNLGALLNAGQAGGSGCTCVTEGHPGPRALALAVSSLLQDGLMPGLPQGLARRALRRAWGRIENKLGVLPES